MKNGPHNNWGCDWNIKSLRRRIWNGQSQAHAAVTQAVARGDLIAAKEFQCADCGKPASDYDHRDYGKPLKVVAVCRSCNLRRGRALPKRWLPEEAAQLARDQIMKCCDWKMATNPDLNRFECAKWHTHHWILARKTGLAHWVAARQIFHLRDMAHELFPKAEALLYEAFATDECLASYPWMQRQITPEAGKTKRLETTA